MGQPAERVKPWAKALGRGASVGGRSTKGGLRHIRQVTPFVASSHGDGEPRNRDGPAAHHVLPNKTEEAAYATCPEAVAIPRADGREVPSGYIKAESGIALKEQQPAGWDFGRQRMNERLMEAREVADMLGVAESWVRAQTRAGRIPHVPLGRWRRYRREAIQRWIEEQERSDGK